MLQFQGYDDIEEQENDDENGMEDDDDDSDSDDSENESENDSKDDVGSDDDFLNRDDAEGLELVRCAAHTLALAVNDTIKTPTIKPRMKKITKLVKLLNTPNMRDELKKKNLKRPKKNNKTRWNTNYVMMDSLVPLKMFCVNEVKDVRLTKSDWTFCETFIEIFKPVRIATKRLQSQQLTLGDFYKVWLQLTLEIKKLTTTTEKESKVLATELHKNLMKRESFIFNSNKSLVAALYLDPRFRNILTKLRPDDFNLKEPQEHLLALYKKIKNVEVSFFEFSSRKLLCQNDLENRSKFLYNYPNHSVDHTISIFSIIRKSDHAETRKSHPNTVLLHLQQQT